MINIKRHAYKKAGKIFYFYPPHLIIILFGCHYLVLDLSDPCEERPELRSPELSEDLDRDTDDELSVFDLLLVFS
jgi:hypothetical protein